MLVSRCDFDALFVFRQFLIHCIKELTVLICRMIFPLHSICAAIQSTGVVRRDVERDSHCKLGVGILLPAVLLHGSFDWVLFMGDFFGTDILSILLAMLFLLLSVGYYFWEAKKQRERLQSRDLQVSVDQSSLI